MLKREARLRFDDRRYLRVTDQLNPDWDKPFECTVGDDPLLRALHRHHPDRAPPGLQED